MYIYNYSTSQICHIVSDKILSHSSWNFCQNQSTVVGFLAWTLFPITFQRFSIGLISEHSKNFCCFWSMTRGIILHKDRFRAKKYTQRRNNMLFNSFKYCSIRCHEFYQRQYVSEYLCTPLSHNYLTTLGCSSWKLLLL